MLVTRNFDHHHLQMAISCYTNESYHFLMDGKSQMATGGIKPMTEKIDGSSVYPQAIMAPNVQKTGIAYLDRFMPKYIARIGAKNMAPAIVKKTDSNIRGPTISTSLSQSSLKIAANEQTAIQNSLNITAPPQTKPIHCTTTNARGFGSSFPPFTLALSTALITRTSPIIVSFFG